MKEDADIVFSFKMEFVDGQWCAFATTHFSIYLHSPYKHILEQHIHTFVRFMLRISEGGVGIVRIYRDGGAHKDYFGKYDQLEVVA